MNILKLLPLGVTVVLGACSTASTDTPTISGSAATFGGTYFITQKGVTRVLPAPDGQVAALGLDYWNNLAERGYMYEGADAIVIAVMDVTSNETFAGVSGTPATAVPTSGTAGYAGAFSATYFRGGTENTVWNGRGVFNTTVDFGSGKIRGLGAGTYSTSLFIDGTITGTEFNGTAEFSALEYTGAGTAPMTGGLYGAGAATVAGIYRGDAVTGVFWGQ